VIKLLAVICVREMNNQDAIIRLDNMQLNREQIADAVGVSRNNVAVVLCAASKKGAAKKGKTTQAPAEAAEVPEVEARPQ